MAKNPTEFESATENYSVVGVLGEGGAGRVFECRASDDKLYAIKALRFEGVSAAHRSRFKNELWFLRRNEHRNVVTVLDEGLVDWGRGVKGPFYVMPLYGQTLRKAMADGLAANAVLPIFSQILDGVEAAHLKKVVHRDLKPENILCDPHSNSYVVADFGVASFQEGDLLTAIETKASDRLANFVYAAPEQRIRGAEVTASADLFALGLILNEMITAEVLQGTGYRKIGEVAPQLAFLEQVVDRLVRQKPHDRYGSIDDIKKDLLSRNASFLARQAVDELSKKVVPVHEAGEVLPVNVADVDWNANVLTIKLDRVPEPGWVERFRNPRSGYTSMMGAEPQRFVFQNGRAQIQAEARNAQAVLDHFKRYSEMATRDFQDDQKREAEQRRANEKAQLEAERKAAEQRATVLEKLRF